MTNIRQGILSLMIVTFCCAVYSPAFSQSESCDGIAVTAGTVEKQLKLCLKPGGGAENGHSFKDCAQCPEMVVVPAGSFMMGSPNTEIGDYEYSSGKGEKFSCRDANPVPVDCHNEKESPQHKVSIPTPFAIGKFAITFDEWDACRADGGCNPDKPAPDDYGWGRGRRPVIDVSWADTKAYLQWLSKKTGNTYRLPSEAEWEYAARAGTTTPYWWGQEATTKRANFRFDTDKPNPNGSDYLPVYLDEPDGISRKQTLPVDEFLPNPWGLYQVHGNVFEWTEDCFHKTYQKKPKELNNTGGAWKVGDCMFRMVRGGSYEYTRYALRSASRHNHVFHRGWLDLGFRVVRELP